MNKKSKGETKFYVRYFFLKLIKKITLSLGEKKNPVGEFDPKRQVFKHSFQGVVAWNCECIWINKQVQIWRDKIGTVFMDDIYKSFIKSENY